MPRTHRYRLRLNTFDLLPRPGVLYGELLVALGLPALAASLEAAWSGFYSEAEVKQVVGEAAGPRVAMAQRRWSEEGAPPVLPDTDYSEERLELCGVPDLELLMEGQCADDHDPTPATMVLAYTLGAEDPVVLARAVAVLEEAVEARPFPWRSTFARWTWRAGWVEVRGAAR